MSDAQELSDMYGPDYIDILIDMACEEEDHDPEQWEIDLDRSIDEALDRISAREDLAQSDDLTDDEAGN